MSKWRGNDTYKFLAEANNVARNVAHVFRVHKFAYRSCYGGNFWGAGRFYRFGERTDDFIVCEKILDARSGDNCHANRRPIGGAFGRGCGGGKPRRAGCSGKRGNERRRHLGWLATVEVGRTMESTQADLGKMHEMTVMHCREG